MTVVRRTARHARATVAAAAMCLLLTSCGESGDTDSAEDPSTPGPSSSEPSSEASPEPTEPTETDDGEEPEPTSPACSEVWVDGQDFPDKYAGCFDEDKQRWVQAMVYRCSSGQHLVTYRRTFYAAKGEQVNETEVPLARDPEFKKALASCGA